MAADESISIEITDKVAPTIDGKIRTIAQSSRDAYASVEKLKNALKQIGGTGSLSKLQTDSTRLASQLLRTSTAQEKLALASAKTGLANQKLATETQRTQAAMAAVEVALNKAVIAEDKAAASAAKLSVELNKAQISSQNLATAQANTAAAMARAQVATQQLATAQAQTAQAAARAQQAQTQANTAATQGATAAAALATATARTAAAQTQTATAAQRLATEQQRTAIQTNNAAASADRAALATLRLQQAQQRLSRTSTQTASAMGSFVRSMAGVLGVGLSAHAILASADAYTVLNNKLQNVATSQAQVAVLSDRLFQIANDTRTPVQETATAFSRFDRALKILGKSQQETLTMTETVNKALVVSGATAGETASVLLQLSQGFNAGKLQGDEFRSVAENMPMVLDAVAKVLNKPIDQIKKLGTEGKITAEVLFKAFELMKESVDKTFANTIPTISQALTVFGNNFIQTFGKFDKAIGLTAGLSTAIIFLANNMDTLLATAAAVGAGLLIYFGPVLLSALGAATTAVWAFTAALLANPIGLVAVAIAAATFAIIKFGDEIAVSADGMVTLKDVFRTAWSDIKIAAGTAASFIKDAWNGAIDAINAATGGWSEQFRDVSGVILSIAKTYVNSVIRVWVGAFTIVKTTWYTLPVLMKGFLASVVNFTATAVEQIINMWQVGLRLIADGMAKIAPDMAAGLTNTLNNMRVTLPRMNVDPAAKSAAEDVKTAITDVFNTDFVGNFMGRAHNLAQTRKRNQRQGVGETELRGSGPSQLSGEGGGGKAAESRAKAMQKVNGELDNEINRLFMLKPLREAQAKFDEIELALKQKKITLSAAEAQSIKERIKLIQDSNFVQAEFDRIYEASVEPMRTHNAILDAADKLLKQGAISQRTYTGELAAANEAYQNSVNPIRQYTKELDEQINLLKLAPPARAVEQQMLQITNDLLSKKIVLTAKETDELRNNILAQQEQANQSAALDNIYANTIGATSSLMYEQQALNASYASGAISQEYFTSQMAQTSIAIADLKNQLGDGDIFSVFTAAAGAALQGFSTMAKGVSDILGQAMSTAIDGFSSSVAKAIVTGQSLKESIHGIAQTILTDMLSALIKLGIQTLINATIGQAAMTASTAASIAAAGTMATAWAPAAAAVSLASWGSNGIAAVAAISAANIAAMSFANIKGFEEGGFTGNVGRQEIAGVVHGKEFVMNANATSRIGVQDLKALQSGAASVQKNGANVGKAAKVADSNTTNADKRDTKGRLPTPVVMHIHGVKDADSFKRSEGQIAARLGSELNRANQRNN